MVWSSRTARALWSSRPLLRSVPTGRLARLSSVLTALSRSDEASETLLAKRFEELPLQGGLSEYETEALARLRDLMRLRSLAFGQVKQGDERWVQGLLPRAYRPLEQAESLPVVDFSGLTKNAAEVADLYWKLFESCDGAFLELVPLARQLFAQIFGRPFDASARGLVARRVDSVQRDGGVAFLILNLLRQGAVAHARHIAQALQIEELTAQEEERATALYWLAELTWFEGQWNSRELTHEASLQNLYHLCFAAPGRAGFLEIDGAFAAEYEFASELAAEAFEYKKTLVQNILELWSGFEEEASEVFIRPLSALLDAPRLLSERHAAERLWQDVQSTLGRDYLYVVQGNQAYHAGQWAEAVDCYETALALTPDLRPAALNLLLAYARLGRVSEHTRLVERLRRDERFLPGVLSVAGHSLLLLGEYEASHSFHEMLGEIPGWESRRDFYRSQFCLHHGFLELALEHAERAHARHPKLLSVVHHLSVCYSALGKKKEALEVLSAVKTDVDWVEYFRFTLQRDLERYNEARETLLRIPSDYFQDAPELDAALTFARVREDLVLLRHLRTKNKRG